MATALGGGAHPTADAMEVDPPRASADEKVNARFTSSPRSPRRGGDLRGLGAMAACFPPAWICLCAADLLAAAFSAPWTQSWFWSICDMCAAAAQDLGCSPAAASFQWLVPSFFFLDLGVDGVSLETVRASCGSFAFRGGNLLLNAVSSPGNFA